MSRDQSSCWKDLIAILFFWVVARTLATTFFPALASSYFLNLLTQGAMYGLLLLSCAVYLRLDRTNTVNLIGTRPSAKAWIFGIAWVAAMLMLALGESALEAWAVSQFNRDLAYRLWNFHETQTNPRPPYSLHVLVYVAVTTILAPAAEEFFFRGLLLPALTIRRNIHAAVAIQALVFTLLHVVHPYLLSTFAFAASLGYVYLVTRSLWLCVGIHACFNLVAFLHQYYFDIHWTRSVTELDALAYWRPHWVMLLVSCLVIVLTIHANKSKLRSAAAAPDWQALFAPRSNAKRHARP